MSLIHSETNMALVPFNIKLHCSLILMGILFTLNLRAQPGCTDPLATNYNAGATQNDGTCLYAPVSVVPVITLPLDTVIFETSGLIYWNDKLWTHNDNFDAHIYSIDTLDGALISNQLLNAVNVDWEEISQDDNYIYVGDVGNNVTGNRTDLKILRIEKSSVISGSPVIDTIFFSYADQTDFTNMGFNNTDYDCEAFIVTTDSIYLFTKQWLSTGTSVYVMPKNPGVYSAVLRENYNVQGLITGATLLEDENLIVLCGYNSTLSPFVYCLYDFNSTGFFSGNKRKINVTLPLHQVEAITTSNGLKYYLTNDILTFSGVTITPQKFHIIDLSLYLSNYLSSLTGVHTGSDNTGIEIYPNPASEKINIRVNGVYNYSLFDLSGKKMLSGLLHNDVNSIDASHLETGRYLLSIGNSYTRLINIVQTK